MTWSVKTVKGSTSSSIVPRTSSSQVERTSPPSRLEEIHDFLADRIAGFTKPTRWEIVNELPRSAFGKLQKHRLREDFATEG